MNQPSTSYALRGFTLVELSIVLVIIGLIVGGVLVGQELITAATLRSQITQIEKYNTAANTFRTKYGFLPGDIPSPAAQQYGFAARGTLCGGGPCQGEGDGNNVIEGDISYNGGQPEGDVEAAGETVMFWVDLSKSKLIDGSFTTATSAGYPLIDITATSSPNLAAFFPRAKMGRTNYVYVWSGGLANTCCPGQTDNINYFAVSSIDAAIDTDNGEITYSNLAMSANEAYAIDKKLDDGLPTSGRVMAMLPFDGFVAWAVSSGGPSIAIPTVNAVTAGSATCFDNGGSASSVSHYSTEVSQGTGLNCGLSFKFQ